MDLNQQIQALIDSAPQDGATPRIVATIAPALKLLADSLRHPHYYILQTKQRDWVLTTLSNRAQPSLEKQVIYAYPTREDAMTGILIGKNPPVIAEPVLVVNLLFQILALDKVDSIIFFEIPGNRDRGTEVRRQDVQNLIQSCLQEILPVLQADTLPPDIAWVVIKNTQSKVKRLS